MATIKVPKPPRAAFNPNRRASDLLKQQIEHLEWAVRHAGERRAGYARSKPRIRTEEDAARRTAELVQRLPSAAQLPTYTAPIASEPAPATTRARKKKPLKKQQAKKKQARKARRALETKRPQTRKEKKPRARKTKARKVAKK